MTAYTYENTRYVHNANHIRRKKIILLMHQMTEPCTMIIKHGLQSLFLSRIGGFDCHMREVCGLSASDVHHVGCQGTCPLSGHFRLTTEYGPSTDVKRKAMSYFLYMSEWRA